jgi:hypothetical protein
MSEIDDRWSLIHLQDCDERESQFGIGTFRMGDEDSLTHRVVWSRLTRGWARMCDNMGLSRKEVNNAPAIDPGAVTCFQCLGKGA